MNIVVQCAVRRPHQMDQAGLAEANRVLFCNANEKKKKKLEEEEYIATEDILLCTLQKWTNTGRNCMLLHGATLTWNLPIKLIAYLLVDHLRLSKHDKIRESVIILIALVTEGLLA